MDDDASLVLGLALAAGGTFVAAPQKENAETDRAKDDGIHDDHELFPAQPVDRRSSARRSAGDVA